MGIKDVDRMLPANKMVFEVRRDIRLFQSFQQNAEPVMERYGLSETEKQAFRDIDIAKLAELGLHPYFLPQVSRLFHGSAYNHNQSEAAQVYAKYMVEMDPPAEETGNG